MTVRGAFKILLVLLFVYNVCEARGGGGRVSFHGGGRGISLRGIAAKAFISRVGRGTRTGRRFVCVRQEGFFFLKLTFIVPGDMFSFNPLVPSAQKIL